MKREKLIRRTAVILAISILMSSLLFLLGAGLLTVYRRRHVDYDVDEQLFLSAKGGNITRYFSDSTGRCELSGYIPVEIESISDAPNRKLWYSYGDIGDNLKGAFISAEDRKFFSHHGVDILRTARALLNSVFKFEPTFGASTITQQVVKNISGDSEITFQRKLSEILRALHIEAGHSKEEIFEMYMNIVPMSDNMAGVGIASNVYFGKEPSELSISEAATLVGITNAPTRYNPRTSPEKCKEKRDKVIFSMYDSGFITEEEYKMAKSEPLEILESDNLENAANSWFIETVASDVTRDLAVQLGLSESAAALLVASGGLSIFTTENPDVQETLESYFENLNNFPSKTADGLNYGMVVVDSKTGNLLGIVGGVGEKRANRLLNYATVPHTPGSALKPLALYAPIIDSGRGSWASVFDDVPVSFDENQRQFPYNYPNVYDGLTTLKDALRLSKNTVAVRLCEMLGKEEIYYNLKTKFGFDSLIRSEILNDGSRLTDLAISPLALGQLTYGVTLRKLTEAYTVFPSYGVLNKGRSYIAVYDNKGELILDNNASSERIFSDSSAKIMNMMLSEVTGSGTAKAIKLKNQVQTAGKTGTSGDDKDRLFVGYTPYITAGIWCGYERGDKSIGAVSKSHITIWDEVMSRIHERILDKERPIEKFSKDGLVRAAYCKDSGKLYSAECMLDARGCRMEYGYFRPSDVPRERCDIHIVCEYDSLTGGIASPGCPGEDRKLVALLDINWRSFPKEIIITDAEYVYRRVSDGDRLGDSYDVPYFIYTIDDGVYVGRSKGKKQFNSECYLHND